jgi:hypothetical protein
LKARRPEVDIDAGNVRVRVDGPRVEVSVGQSELPELAAQDRLVGPLVMRVERQLQGGGFGDPTAHPCAWGVFVEVDGRLARLPSARGIPREWTSLDRLESWLLSQGFREWRVVNHLDAAP